MRRLLVSLYRPVGPSVLVRIILPFRDYEKSTFW